MINTVFDFISSLNDALWTYFALWLLVGSAVGMFLYLRLYRLFRPSVMSNVFRTDPAVAADPRSEG